MLNNSGLDHARTDQTTDEGLQWEQLGVAPADHPVRPDAGLQEHRPQGRAGGDMGGGRGQAGGERQADEEGGRQESLR